jgi:hypothetical protein
LPELAAKSQNLPDEEGPCWGQQVTLQQVWFQLSPTERQRFGHCFSRMVLKALVQSQNAVRAAGVGCV